VPFAQASSAEQLRVSVGMGLAINPIFRVILIKDGSLLDEDSRAMIAEMAAEHDVGFRVAGWYWTTRQLNTLADRNTATAFRQITKKINGGLNGLEDRERYWRRAKEVLYPPEERN
jgi:hypothetical protein